MRPDSLGVLARVYGATIGSVLSSLRSHFGKRLDDATCGDCAEAWEEIVKESPEDMDRHAAKKEEDYDAGL